jgi:hypothetical protein
MSYCADALPYASRTQVTSCIALVSMVDPTMGRLMLKVEDAAALGHGTGWEGVRGVALGWLRFGSSEAWWWWWF